MYDKNTKSENATRAEWHIDYLMQNRTATAETSITIINHVRDVYRLFFILHNYVKRYANLHKLLKRYR